MTNQPGDPRASLLLTSLRRRSFAKSAISVGDGFPYQDWTSHFPASWKWRRLTQYGDGYVHDNDHLTQAILLAPKVLLEDRWHMMTSWPVDHPYPIPIKSHKMNEWTKQCFRIFILLVAGPFPMIKEKRLGRGSSRSFVLLNSTIHRSSYMICQFKMNVWNQCYVHL